MIDANVVAVHVDVGEAHRRDNDPRHAHTNPILMPKRQKRPVANNKPAKVGKKAKSLRKNVFRVERLRNGAIGFTRATPSEAVPVRDREQIQRNLFELHQPKHLFLWLPELQRRADLNRVPMRRSLRSYCPFRGRNSRMRTFRSAEINRMTKNGFDVRARVMLANPGLLNHKTVARFAL